MVGVLRIEKLERKVLSPTRELCIDIDTIDKVRGKELEDWDTSYRLLKALYMYSFLKRLVKQSRHGYHIYLDIDIRALDCYRITAIKTMFGDDIERIHLDDTRCVLGYWVNVCFTSSEIDR